MTLGKPERSTSNWVARRQHQKKCTDEINRQTFTLDFLAFCFVQPAQAFEFNSQLLARERRAFAQSEELGPGDLRVDAAAEAAVGAGHDVFSADDFSERDDGIGYQRISLR